MTVEKNLAHLLKYSLVQLRGNSCSSTSLKKSQVSSTNFRDKLQHVNVVKRSVFDLTKRPPPFLKSLISIWRLIVEVLNYKNLFTESNLGNWFSSYVQFCSGGNFSEKVNHLNFHLLVIFRTTHVFSSDIFR